MMAREGRPAEAFRLREPKNEWKVLGSFFVLFSTFFVLGPSFSF